ncbi:hypothetical protein [Streptomyces sp. NPDC056527]|uniref:hypothetical protein n=1 Tax=Streptomyces sp. NPDC056527 TaxID=3345853 RepID=UPI0036A0142D
MAVGVLRGADEADLVVADGVAAGVVDSGEACRLCEVRAADWKAAQTRKRQPSSPPPVEPTLPAVPSQRAAARTTPLLKDCTGPYCNRSIPGAGDDLCSDCQDATAQPPAPFYPAIHG